jgi:DNA replication protein DnaC
MGWRVTDRGAVRCDCMAETIETRLERAGVPEAYRDAEIHSLELGNGNPTLTDALITCSSWITAYPNSVRPGLLLVGSCGVGKTHLACAVLRALLERGVDCLYLDYLESLEAMREGMKTGQGRQLIQAACSAEVLLWDDIGAQRATDWTEDTVTTIVNHRYNHKQSMILTTNLSDREDPRKMIDTLSDRIGSRSVSRLMEVCQVVRVIGPDYRLKMKLM